jgi:hypothetical protein
VQLLQIRAEDALHAVLAIQSGGENDGLRYVASDHVVTCFLDLR